MDQSRSYYVTRSTGTLVSYSYNMRPFWICHVFVCLFRMWRPSGRIELYHLIFSLYDIDDVIKHKSNSRYCCNVRFTCASIFMYADDLILMSPSVTVLQKLFKIVEEDLTALEMSINPSKSACIRFGPRY